jgi:hypothetical protein
MDVNE